MRNRGVHPWSFDELGKAMRPLNAPPFEDAAKQIEEDLNEQIETTHMLAAIDLIAREVSGALRNETLDKETRLRLLMAQQCVLDAKESYEDAR